jgi:CDP-diacylglycerol--glycerol-3-phosphate 3-phosphatidyltransferase
VTDWDTYAERWSALHGGYDPRRAPAVVRGWLWLAHRVARQLAKTPLSPGAVTAAGLVISAGVPPLAWAGGGWLLAGVLLVLATALADTVDGALAVMTGRTSRLGQVYDSVADRLTEACWLVGLAFAGAPAPLAALGVVAWLHEYVRARAEVAGMADLGVVTVGERPTRVIVAVFGLALAGVLGGWAATAATAVWVVLGTVGLIQLHAAVRRALRVGEGSGRPDEGRDRLR